MRVIFQGSGFVQEERNWVMEWLDGKPSPRMRSAYAETIQGLIDYLPSSIRLRDIELNHLQSYLLSKAHLSESTQARHTAAIGSLFPYLTTRKRIPENLAMHLKKVKVINTTSKRHLSEQEIFAILGVEKSGRNYLLLKLMYGQR
jgi:site-specific recombinase XerD